MGTSLKCSFLISFPKSLQSYDRIEDARICHVNSRFSRLVPTLLRDGAFLCMLFPYDHRTQTTRYSCGETVDLLVLFVFEHHVRLGQAVLVDKALDGAISQLLEQDAFEGKCGQTLMRRLVVSRLAKLR